MNLYLLTDVLKQYSCVVVVIMLLIGMSLSACRSLPHALPAPSCPATVEARLQGKTVHIERVDGTRIERVRLLALSREQLTYETADGVARELPLDEVRAIEVRTNRGGLIGSLIGAAPGVALYVVASRTKADDIYDEMAVGWGKAGGLLLGLFGGLVGAVIGSQTYTWQTVYEAPPARYGCTGSSLEER